MPAHRNRASLTAAGCDDCSWQPRPGIGVDGARTAANQHAVQHGHSAFVMVEQTTNYDHRRPEPRTSDEARHPNHDPHDRCGECDDLADVDGLAPDTDAADADATVPCPPDCTRTRPHDHPPL